MALSKNIPKYQTMTEMAARLIRERVFSGQYKSGDRLIPEKLEAEIGLGRAAIRESLRELVGSGLVVSLPNKGIIVANPPAPEEIKPLYEARYALEGEVTYQAAKKITPSVIEHLEDLVQQMTIASKTSEYLAYNLLNNEFHLILYEASGWETTCHIITQLFDQTLIYRSLHTSWMKDSFAGFNHDHQEIIKALKSGNAEAAKKNVISNIHRGFNQYSLDGSKKNRTTRSLEPFDRIKVRELTE